jgi:hypothetical protein
MPPMVRRSPSGTMRTPYSRPMRTSVSRLSRASAVASAARTACNWTILVSLNCRASSAARSWRKSRMVAAIASAITASSTSARRPNSERGSSLTAAPGQASVGEPGWPVAASGTKT